MVAVTMPDVAVASVLAWSVVAVPLLTDGFIAKVADAVGSVGVDQVISSPVRVVMELASMVPEVLPSRVLRISDVERGVGEGDVLVAQACDGAVVVGGVGGVEISCSTGEGGDVAGIDGNGGFAIEGVERCCINGGVRDGDGVGVAGFAEASECGQIAIREGGGDDSGCGIGECLAWSVVAVPLSR